MNFNEFKIEKDNLCLRSCDEHLTDSNEHTTAEIVKYSDTAPTSCHTIASWDRRNEGYRLKFVHTRPFDENIDKDLFWELAKLGQKLLEEENK